VKLPLVLSYEIEVGIRSGSGAAKQEAPISIDATNRKDVIFMIYVIKSLSIYNRLHSSLIRYKFVKNKAPLIASIKKPRIERLKSPHDGKLRHETGPDKPTSPGLRPCSRKKRTMRPHDGSAPALS
jgi:hypothetical protein